LINHPAAQAVLGFLDSGLLDFSGWQILAYTLITTHITIAAVTIYLHRSQAHRALDLHPVISHFFRLWLWLTTGMSTKGWTAVHRKHHAFVEQAGDPHSPQVFGIKKVFFEGAELYREAVNDPATLAKYGHGTPEDWLEQHVYSRLTIHGVALMLLLDLLLFGVLGLTVWAVQMIWIPLFAAGVINGLGHWRGYRNFETQDGSTNLLPWGLLIGGEELHNNHHAFATSARFSVRPWEFDIGWAYIRGLELLGLASVKRVVRAPMVDAGKSSVDLETLRAVVASHVHVLADYARRVVYRVHQDEVAGAPKAERHELQPLKRLIPRADHRLGERERAYLRDGLSKSRALATVYEFQQRLLMLFSERQASQERLLQSLQEWCEAAEATGIAALEEFARRLAGYRLVA
jgi:stearoyl-CoA desaturase (delta-9 desaturase)